MWNVVWFVDARGWGMWYGSWMGVDGECVFADGGIWGIEDRRIGRIKNRGNLKYENILNIININSHD